jgi:predicted RNA-binding protein
MSPTIKGPDEPGQPTEINEEKVANTDAVGDAQQTTFADRLAQAQADEAARVESAGQIDVRDAARAADPAARIAAELDAGTLSPDEAVEQLIDASLDAQLPADMPDAVRAEIRVMLRDMMGDDPILSGAAARLSAHPGED